MSPYDFVITTGLFGGETVQFAEGHWPGEIGAGIAITEEGFDLVEPHLRLAAPDWTGDHRYAVFELRVSARKDLATRIRIQAVNLRSKGDTETQSPLLEALAAWLEKRFDEEKPVGVFGI